MVSSRHLRVACLTLANLLLPVAVLVFAAGFFPYKPVLPGLADWQDGDDGERDVGPEAHAPFNKVIFMVVDALRSDFVFGEDSAMGFVQRFVHICRLNATYSLTSE
jgi:ethanolaminephosphotransferase